jgi:hypothetical protein
MLSHIGRRITSDTRHFHSIHTSTTNRAFSMSSSGGPIRLNSASDTSPQQQHPCVDSSQTPITMPCQQSKDMRLSRSYLAIFLSLILLPGLAGCGPASSDNAPNLESSASGDGPAARGTEQGGKHFVPPLASDNRTGSASGTGAVPGGADLHAVSVLSSEPGHPIDGLVVPEWMAQKLNSPKVRVRLQALETWAQSAPPGAVDPLILAFEDKDERVRARAQQLLEQDWAQKAEAEK